MRTTVSAAAGSNGRVKVHRNNTSEKPAFCFIRTFSVFLKVFVVLLDNFLFELRTRRRGQRKIFHPLIGTSRIDNGPRAETFLVLGDDRIQRAAPSPANKIHVLDWIDPRAHGPKDIIHVVNIDVVIDDDYISSQVSPGPALGSNHSRLLRMPGVTLLDRYHGKKSSLIAGNASNVRHTRFL